MEVVASLCQGRTAAAQCGLFTYKSVQVIFEPPCSREYLIKPMKLPRFHNFFIFLKFKCQTACRCHSFTQRLGPRLEPSTSRRSATFLWKHDSTFACSNVRNLDLMLICILLYLEFLRVSQPLSLFLIQ